MQSPPLSDHIKTREPSSIRLASIKFAQRTDGVKAVNVAIGNVSLPMHPAMIERMRNLGAASSPFHDGVVGYTATVGTDEARQAVLNIIASSGCPTDGLHCQITDGGSQSMELIIVATGGAAGSKDRPLMLIDAAYTNYVAFAQRLGRATVSVSRTLQQSGKFTLPPLGEMEALVRERRPAALVVIPYDNPTGHYYDRPAMVSLARLCVAHNLWIISDEAYREMYYVGGPPTSIWSIDESEVPGIRGRRVSIETASKVWNACGLRIGALVTDNQELHTRAVAENTASLCASAIGQYIFGSLAHISHAELLGWYQRQRTYYQGMLSDFTDQMHALLPDAIVSSPDASIYSVVDVRQMVGDQFDATEFVLYCASQGFVETEDGPMTLLVAPMSGFYDCPSGAPNPGRTQMRVAYVEPPHRMRQVPRLFATLLSNYLERTPPLAAR